MDNGTEPLRVAVVRPKVSTPQIVGKVIGALVGSALNAWVLMTILGAVTPWHLGYWNSVLVLVGLRCVQIGPGWLQWTHSGQATR